MAVSKKATRKGEFVKLNKSGLKELQFNEDTVKKLREINASDEQIRALESPYRCTCCGRRYKKQQGNFMHSESILYNNNNHYVTVCKSCVDSLLDQYTSLLGSQDAAIKRICMKLDIYFSESTCKQAVKKEEDTSRMSNYISKLNLQQNAGKTFDTYLSEISERGGIDSYDDLDNYNEGERITKAMFERWQGNTPEDIIALEQTYRSLARTNPNADNNQMIFIRQLAIIQLMQNKAQKKNDIAAFEKCIKMYRETFRQAGLQTVQEEDSSVQNPLGVNAEIISQYTPEEFYKDKKLYEDYDGIGEYFATHVERPLENLMFHANKTYDIGDSNETQ